MREISLKFAAKCPDRGRRGTVPAAVPKPPSNPNAAGGRPTGELALGRRPHFSLFGIPVRIGAGFLITVFVFGSSGPTMQAAAVRVAIVFVSILVHELGHALVARAFGARPSIEMHALGGLTHLGEVPFTRARHALVSLAGPFAGFALGLVIWLATRNVALNPVQAELVRFAVWWVSLGWGVINLLPVLPFDGGQVLAAALGPRRILATAIISTAVGALVALLGWVVFKNIFIVFFFGSSAVRGVALARRALEARSDTKAGLEEAIGKAREALAREAWGDAMVLADDVVRRAKTLPVRNAGWTALAWAHAGKGEGVLAREALGHIEPRSAIDPYTIAVVEDAAGAPARARGVLVAARDLGMRSAEMTRLLVDLHARDGRLDQAVEIAIEDAALLPHDDGRAVLAAALEGGQFRRAAALADRMFELFADPRDVADEARALARAHEIEPALRALSRAVEMGALRVAELAEDPAFASLREDERFRALMS
jgi:Zn-dependent protease